MTVDAESVVLMTAQDLAIEYGTPGAGIHRALDGTSLHLRCGEILGIVGESGSGKSTLGLAVGRLLPAIAKRPGGDLRIDGRSVFDMDEQAIRALRRETLGFVFQNPMLALDPTLRAGRQVALAAGSRAPVRDLLARVGLRDVERVEHSFPHQLSGGMAQRVMIAMAIARGPRLLVADEPTASLDATLREHIFELLLSLRDSTGTSVVILSHELRSVARHCDTVAVMYAGRVVEHGPAAEVFASPSHPYTLALLTATPGRERPGEALPAIAGTPPVLHAAATRCAFAPRCGHADALCHSTRPEAQAIGSRIALCHHPRH